MNLEFDDGVEAAAPAVTTTCRVEPTVLRGSRRSWLAHCSVVVALLSAALIAAPRVALAAASAPPAPLGKAVGHTVLVVGDSLSAEYGLTRGSGWVALMQERLKAKKIEATVVNASISGDTTDGGRSRLAPLLAQYRPAVVVLELGGNDALRGLPLEGTRANLAAMSRLAKAAGSKVVIVGMQVPPNYGRAYSEQFAGLFGDVAEAEGAALVPFMLKGVADVPDYPNRFQADGIHPKESQHPIILDNIWPTLDPLIKAR